MLVSALRRAMNDLFDGTFWGHICLMFIIINGLYNCSETAYFRGTPIWFLFLLVTTKCQRGTQEMLIQTREDEEQQSHSAREVEAQVSCPRREIMAHDVLKLDVMRC